MGNLGLMVAGDGGRPPTGVLPRRRRVRDDRELATPLAASFLGLLLVHGLGSAEAAPAPDSPGSIGEPETLPAHADGGQAGGIGSGLPTVLAPAFGAGAHAANLIEAGTLTRLAGEAQFPGGPQLGATAAAATGAIPTAAPTTVAALDLSTAPGSLAWPSLPAVPAPDAEPVPEPDPPGPIGKYVRGDGTDRTVVLTDDDDSFIGGDGDEHVLGGGGDDHLDGAGGDDHLDGGAGDDTLLGGKGDDLLAGGAGDDQLDGGLDDDVLAGGAGDDHLLGGGGNDQLDGGTGTDLLEGGTGNEILVLADVRDAVTELALGADGGGNDTVVVAEGYGQSLAAAMPSTRGEATFVLGRPDLDAFPHGFASFRQQIDPDIENIRLQGQFDHDVVGDARDSAIVGNAGDNRIFGGGGEDDVWGGDGDDWLAGGDGDDTLYGGAGDDTFVLGLHEGGDRIFDHQGRNTLRLDGADPDRLTAMMQGDDLVLSHADRVLATLQDYGQHADHFAGIDLGHGLRGLDEFMAEPGARAMAQMAAGDWLADYLPDAAMDEAQPLPEPWSVIEGEDLIGDVADPGPVPPEDGAGMSAGAEPEPWHDPGFAGDPVMGDADLWLPVDLPTDGGLDAADQVAVGEPVAEERERAG